MGGRGRRNKDRNKGCYIATNWQKALGLCARKVIEVAAISLFCQHSFLFFDEWRMYSGGGLTRRWPATRLSALCSACFCFLQLDLAWLGLVSVCAAELSLISNRPLLTESWLSGQPKLIRSRSISHSSLHSPHPVCCGNAVSSFQAHKVTLTFPEYLLHSQQPRSKGPAH